MPVHSLSTDRCPPVANFIRAVVCTVAEYEWGFSDTLSWGLNWFVRRTITAEMELPQYSLKTLPAHYRALLNTRRAIPSDVTFLASLPDASARFVAFVISLPLGCSWLYVVYNKVFAAYHPGGMLSTLFFMVSGIVVAVWMASSFSSFQLASGASTEARRGRWRYGLYLHHDWLMIRHHPSGKIYLLAHSEVEGVFMGLPKTSASHKVPQLKLDHGTTQTHHDWAQVMLGIHDKQVLSTLQGWYERRRR